jgi:cytosine/adenosine deaminase-related metal-dependent hydrolase/ubiquinone/menaquinone biosynthesis C-methylase UbiE
MMANADSLNRSQLAASRDAFTLWSRVYDHQANPLLSLEERFLAELLLPVKGLDVVDVGCGTGRWLQRLSPFGPSSLTGVDSSPEMVGCAREKLGASATVMLGEAESMPLRSSSADLIVASFVTSYLPEIYRLAAEVRRVARPTARVYLSDLHPATASACKWKRSFKSAGTEVELATYGHSVTEVIDWFEAFGFEVSLLLEPAFESPEREILQAAGKIEAFHAAAGRPAIYILQLGTRERSSKSHSENRRPRANIKISGARLAISPSAATRSSIAMVDGYIATIGWSGHRHSHATVKSATTVDLSGYLVLPGLTNSHDHLEFGLFPNLGRGPYRTFEQWAQDIHQTEHEVIDRQRGIPKDVRLWWGGIRNLLCGVTTVCHHNPIWPELRDDNFPVRVVTEFGWAHSVPLEPQLSAKFAATPEGQPFVLHLAEGCDPKNANEIFELDRMLALDDRTVLVHGLSLNAAGFSLLNCRGAALVWCPTSNQFLFGRTHTWQSLLRANSVVLGSDSPLTSVGDLLDEIRCAHSEVSVSAEELFRMVVTRPPTVFRFTDGRGAIRPGAAADLIAVRDRGKSPAETLVTLSSSDIELVVIGSRVQLASEAVLERLPGNLSSGLCPLEVDGQIRYVRAPLGSLCGITSQTLGCNIPLGNKKVRHVCSAWI